MRHMYDRRQLNRNSAHRKAMFRNMATSLFIHERIRTTEAKAKELRRYAERLITLGKRYYAFGPNGEDKAVAAKKLHVHRQALAYLRDKKAIERLLGELAQRYEERPGGYTRIIRLGLRRGDAAPMVFIELVKPEEVAEPKEKRRRRRRTKAETAEAAPAKAATPKVAKKAAPAPEAAPEEATLEPVADAPADEAEAGTDDSDGGDDSAKE